jgi:hypothetical protein
MRHLIKTTLLSVSLYFICGATFITPDTTSQIYNSDHPGSHFQLYVASFNIETFDLADPDTLVLLADIISRFEIVALQNIPTIAIEFALDKLVQETHSYGHPYDFLIDSNHSHSPSGYAYVYRTDVLYPVQWYTFSGPNRNEFENTAFIARFEHDDGKYDITLTNYLIDNDHTSIEGDFLQAVFNDIKEKFPEELDIIFLGPTDSSCQLSSFDHSGDGSILKDFLCLIDYEQISYDNMNMVASVAPQIIIAAYSEALYWEEGDILRIEESNSIGNKQPISIDNQPGFSGLIVVNTANETNQGSKTKGFCFFSSTFN